METLDGKEIIERLEAIDNAKRSMRYTSIAGIAASHYTGTLEVKPKGRGSVANGACNTWRTANPDIVVKTIVSALQKTGLESLTTRFGVPA
jgi:hypothetical protein